MREATLMHGLEIVAAKFSASYDIPKIYLTDVRIPQYADGII